MKTATIFYVIVVTTALLHVSKINSQIVSAAQSIMLSKQDRAILDECLSEYTVFTIDKSEIIENLNTTGYTLFQLHVDEERDWTIYLEPNDMRAPDFKQTYVTDEGIFESEEPFVVNTFKGQTTNGQIARFTIDENSFSGIILYDHYHYVIGQAKDYTQNNADESLIVCKASDIIAKNEDFSDYGNDTLVTPDDDIERESMEQDSTEGGSRSTPCTYYLKIATDADYEFYQKNMYNLTGSYSEIFSKLNKAEGVYEARFKLKFIVTHQNVWTSTTASGYPYTPTMITVGSNQKIDADILLGNLRTYWNNNMTNVSRNLAHLFTGKEDLFSPSGNSAIVGLAAPGGGHISDNWSYALTQKPTATWSAFEKTVAHEIGHNLNASHPVNTVDCCNLNYQPSLMCQGGIINPYLWFCDESINQITPFLQSKSSNLTWNFPGALTLSGSQTGFNAHQAQQTITSTQVINSGYTSYKAGSKIVLKPGFHAKAGSRFIASIEDPTDCEVKPINLAAWTDVMCLNSPGLQFNITNAIGYNVFIYTTDVAVLVEYGVLITGNPVTVWLSDGVSPGIYNAEISFYSKGEEISNTYQITVQNCSSPRLVTEEVEEIIATEITPPETFHPPYLGQNYPNPFTGETVIPYFLPEGSEKANLRIVNTEGMVLQTVTIAETGESAITLAAHSLPPGVYFYSLLINGQTIDTKRMVVE